MDQFTYESLRHTIKRIEGQLSELHKEMPNDAPINKAFEENQEPVGILFISATNEGAKFNCMGSTKCITLALYEFLKQNPSIDRDITMLQILSES